MAVTPEERAAVYRFWYSIYVEEMGRYRDVADHDRRELSDVEDDTSIIWTTIDEGEVVAASRWSWGGHGFSDRQIEQYELGPFLAELPAEALLVGERTMVAPSHRGGSAAADLMSRSRAFGENLGYAIGFGASEPHLVSFYAQFGQRPYASRQFFSWESGYLIPNFSLPFGAERLGSTLPRCVAEALAGSPSVHNAATDGEESFRAALDGLLGDVRVGVFEGLSGDEVAAIASKATLVRCAAGDHVLSVGGTARNPFVVLDGELEARTEAGTAALVLGPGDVFGETGWLENRDRPADVFASADGTWILALSVGNLAHLDPENRAAARWQENVTRQLDRRQTSAGIAT